jgi:hypothetical protein
MTPAIAIISGNERGDGPARAKSDGVETEPPLYIRVRVRRASVSPNGAQIGFIGADPSFSGSI